MKIKILTVFLVLLSLKGFSQQELRLTDYKYNMSNINPAYVGTRGTTTIFGMRKMQWVGIEGAPITNLFSYGTSLKGNKMGLGFTVSNDIIGPVTDNRFSVDYSYAIPLNPKYTLSFGLKASGNLFNVDFNKLQVGNPGDPANQNNNGNQFSPNVGLGLFAFSEKSYLGISAPFILKTVHFDKFASAIESTTNFDSDGLDLYLSAGHIFDLNESVQLKPSMLIDVAFKNETWVDLSGDFLFNKVVVAGLMYRPGKAVGLNAGFIYKDSWFFGYDYALETTGLSSTYSGTHVFQLRYEIFPKNKQVKSPRFF